MPRIARLSDHLINQIAAGEVVERPASALKELVENSLDAGATRIECLLRDGGMSELTVIDDGEGMGPEDLELCVERHTTSKIRSDADLEAIATFGFRGEALSSMASVAEVEIRTRTRQAASGNQLTIAYGEKGERRPVGCPPGTAISVRRLFERTPARQKFLRSIATEFSHCSRALKEIALGNAGVSFSLHHQGNRQASYTTADRASRFGECLRVAWQPLHVRETHGDLALEAFLSPPQIVQERGELYLFVNGRGVRNRVLAAAVRNTYAELLGSRRDPSGVVFLDIRRDWVDVNVHPQKLEVRCLRQEMLFQFLTTCLRKAIASQPAVRLPSPTVPHGFNEPPPPAHPEGRPEIRYLGQVREAYLLGEDRDGLLLVDSRALRERLRFDEWSVRTAPASRPLPIARILSLSGPLESTLEAHRSLLTSAGFEWEVYGDGDIALKAIPSFLDEAQAETVFRDCVGALREAPLEDPALCVRALYAVACRESAVPPLGPREAESLLARASPLPESATGPDGRRILYRLSFHSIEKHFERV